MLFDDDIRPDGMGENLLIVEQHGRIFLQWEDQDGYRIETCARPQDIGQITIICGDECHLVLETAERPFCWKFSGMRRALEARDELLALLRDHENRLPSLIQKLAAALAANSIALK